MAAEYAGTTASTFHKWVKQVRDLDHEPEDCANEPVTVTLLSGYQEDCTRFCDLWRKTRMAMAEFRMQALDKIRTAPDWQAAAWTLERTLPSEFAKTERLHVSGPDDNKDPLADKISDEQLKQMATGALATIGAATIVRELLAATKDQPSLVPPDLVSATSAAALVSVTSSSSTSEGTADQPSTSVIDVVATTSEVDFQPEGSEQPALGVPPHALP